MDDNERFDYVKEELTAIYEELDNNINQQVLIRHFFKKLLNVANGENPDYQLSKIIKFKRDT